MFVSTFRLKAVILRVGPSIHEQVVEGSFLTPARRPASGAVF